MSVYIGKTIIFMPPQQQLYSVFAIVVFIAIIAGILSIFVHMYPWWYINKKGKEAGLDDFTISQWRWKALWLGWIAIILFKKYLKTLKRESTSHLTSSP